MSRICYSPQAQTAAEQAQRLMTEVAHQKIGATAAKTVARLRATAAILANNHETEAVAQLNEFAQELVSRFNVQEGAVEAALQQVVDQRLVLESIAKSKSSWGKLFPVCLLKLAASAFAEDLTCTITRAEEDTKAVLYTGLAFVNDDRQVEASLLYALARVEPELASELRSLALDLWETHRKVTLKV